MDGNKVLTYIKNLLDNVPKDWLNLTTHRLDIYEEKLAKTQFLTYFEILFHENNADLEALSNLPSAYDYIRLGHPLSCILEWSIAQLNKLKPSTVISFSSSTIPVMAVLRKNLLEGKMTHIFYNDTLPASFDFEILSSIYGYKFSLTQVQGVEEISDIEGSSIYIAESDSISAIKLSDKLDFYVNVDNELGSVLIINGKQNEAYVSDIQHVRRRETIAMTPADCLSALHNLSNEVPKESKPDHDESSKALVLETIKQVTGTNGKPIVASSGLSVQYAILMGLIHHAKEEHQGKAIKIIVPPNCYGGTNDQSRRVAACIKNVEVLDLPVDAGNDMAESIDLILAKLAEEDAVPYIIAEIPTNPRVEVPNLHKLQAVLEKKRRTKKGELAIDPVFILDQTFCPNVKFVGEGEILSDVRTISFSSGSKFPSGGLCTAGYCVGNDRSKALMEKVAKHLVLCDNEATNLQISTLAKQLPSMKQRIHDAYTNTREFVNYIKELLPQANINFVSEDLAKQGFTPSVFSMDLPTKGDSDDERESYKRALNLKLINLMITEIPKESKFCVSYGQLKGCYWTIPATSTQGTTKEGDKDYIVRASLSPNLDLKRHKEVFKKFVEKL